MRSGRLRAQDCQRERRGEENGRDAPGRREYVDAIESLGAVHLREHLVDDSVRHTCRVVAAVRIGRRSAIELRWAGRMNAPLWRDRVELVKEQDARLGGLRALEQIADRLFARADVLVEDLGALDRDKVEAALFRDG